VEEKGEREEANLVRFEEEEEQQQVEKKLRSCKKEGTSVAPLW
jgi:hypothetical protein